MLTIVAHFSGEGNTRSFFSEKFREQGAFPAGICATRRNRGRTGPLAHKKTAGLLRNRLGWMKKALSGGSRWQREKDSNPHIQSQSLLCYPYTIPLYASRPLRSFWQREKDSNPHIQSQSLLCYPYTIPLCFTTKDIIHA